MGGGTHRIPSSGTLPFIWSLSTFCIFCMTVEVFISIPGLVEGQKKKEGGFTLVAFQFLA